MAVPHVSPSLVPDEILNPYPERLNAVAGVRFIPADVVPVDLEVAPTFSARSETSPLAASLELGRRRPRVGRLPVASVLLACLGQMVLALAMTSGPVPGVLGAAVSVSLLVCSLGLIFAQCVTIAGGR